MTASELAFEGWSVVALPDANAVRGGGSGTGDFFEDYIESEFRFSIEFWNGFVDGFRAALTS